MIKAKRLIASFVAAAVVVATMGHCERSEAISEIASGLPACGGRALAMTKLAPGSRFEAAAEVITKSGKTLRISPKALEQMEALDGLMSAREREGFPDMELGGVGLTRKVDDDTTLIVDFIFPNPEKIYYTSHPSLIEGEFGTALAGSKELRLTLQGDNVAAVSDTGNTIVVDYLWEFVRGDVERLSGRQLPSGLKELKALIEKEGRIVITTDWELISSGTTLKYTVSFKERVDREAKRQDASLSFDRHYHPRRAPSVICTKDDYYQEKLKPSDGDMIHWKDQGLEWAEIRMPRLSEGGFISRFYHSSEIGRWAASADEIIKKLQGLSDEDANDYEALNNILEEMFALGKKLSADVELTQVAIFVFANRVSESYPKDLSMFSIIDVRSLRDFVLYEIVYLRRSTDSLKRVLPKALKLHINAGTPQLISRRLAIEAHYPRSRYSWLWLKANSNDELDASSLLLQDDPEKIRRKAEGCKRMLETLEKAIAAGEIGDEFVPSSADFDETAGTRTSP